MNEAKSVIPFSIVEALFAEKDRLDPKERDEGTSMMERQIPPPCSNAVQEEKLLFPVTVNPLPLCSSIHMPPPLSAVH